MINKALFICTLIATSPLFADPVSPMGNIVDKTLSAHNDKPVKVIGKMMAYDTNMAKIAKSVIQTLVPVSEMKVDEVIEMGTRQRSKILTPAMRKATEEDIVTVYKHYGNKETV